MNSVERVKAICSMRKIPISRLEKDLGFSNGYIGQLRRGTFPYDRLVLIADYLGVSEKYLSTGEDEQNAEKPTNPKIGELSEDELDIIADLRRLKQADQDAILRMIRSLSGSGEK